MTNTQKPRAMKPHDGIAWITGASTGIGEAIAIALAQNGWRVVASARSADKLNQLAARAFPMGRIIALPLDVTDDAAVKAAAQTIETQHGPIALAIFNAGSAHYDNGLALNPAAFADIYNLNVMGVVRGIAAVTPFMQKRGHGHIAAVASVAGYRGLPTSIAYSSSKAAVINLMESARFDLQPAGITVQIINPGFVKTPLTDKNNFPMPFLISAERAAQSCVRQLASTHYEINFPWFFCLCMKILRGLPAPLYYALVKNVKPVDRTP